MRFSRMHFSAALQGLIAACALVLAACGDDEAATSAAAKKEDTAAKDDGAAVVDAPKAADLSYTYNAVGRRDPFQTFFDVMAEITKEDDSNLTELQKTDIDRLKLVAVVVGTATPMAMVEDGSGHGHTIKIGTLIGRRLGQVKHIRRGEVIIQEEFRDFTGRQIPQIKELKLDDDEKKLK